MFVEYFTTTYLVWELQGKQRTCDQRGENVNCTVQNNYILFSLVQCGLVAKIYLMQEPFRIGF
jgi:hypothetical protein